MNTKEFWESVTELTASQFQMYCIIDKLADNEVGYCFASDEHIAEKVGKTRKSVNENISALIKSGHIQVLRITSGASVKERRLYPKSNLSYYNIDSKLELIKTTYQISRDENGAEFVKYFNEKNSTSNKKVTGTSNKKVTGTSNKKVTVICSNNNLSNINKKIDTKDESINQKSVENLDLEKVEFAKNFREYIEKVSKATQQDKFRIEQVITPSIFRDLEITEILQKIEESKFLKGELENKPKIGNFTDKRMLNMILLDKYKDGEGRNDKRGKNNGNAEKRKEVGSSDEWW